MVLTVIGTGFVGVVTSSVFADNGHTVYGLDVDVQKISSLMNGNVPFYEPGLENLLRKTLAAKTLSFTTDYAKAIPSADIIMIAVGTPSNHDGSVNLSYVRSAAESLAPHLKDETVIVIKSTVPPGTHDLISSIIGEHTSKRYAVASVPEFLREGSAVEDTLNPDRVVIGTTEPWAQKKLLDLHAFLPGERLIVSRESASLGKYTANAYLAMRITFANQIADICEKTGASISEVLSIAGKDERIGDHYWYPGLGYGGSCFPKDVKELAIQAKNFGLTDHLTAHLSILNERRIGEKMNAFSTFVGGFEGKRVAVLGLSFKPNTTDMREAPSLSVLPFLQKQGADIVAYDPQANHEAKRLFPQVRYASDLIQAISEADVIMLLVEWDELKSLSAETVSTHARESVKVIDTRNQYDALAFRSQGIEILQIGNG